MLHDLLEPELVELISLAEVASTNDEARDRVQRAPGGDAFVITARRQTAGTGRRGTPWHSPDGGLWMTLGAPLHNASTLNGLGLRLGVELCETIDRVLRAHMMRGVPAVSLKWPNDVLIDGRKVLGCMSLTMHAGSAGEHQWLLVGVGVNVNNAPGTLPRSVREHAVSLAEVVQRELVIEIVRAQLIGAICRAVNNDGSWASWVARARGVLHGVGEAYQTHVEGRGLLVGVLRGLDDAGLPIIERD